MRDPLPYEWDVFDTTGEWLGAVTTPERFFPHEIGRDYLAGLHIDELGIHRAAVYRLVRPDN